jgi:hypothetical protein
MICLNTDLGFTKEHMEWNKNCKMKQLYKEYFKFCKEKREREKEKKTAWAVINMAESFDVNTSFALILSGRC